MFSSSLQFFLMIKEYISWTNNLFCFFLIYIVGIGSPNIQQDSNLLSVKYTLQRRWKINSGRSGTFCRRLSRFLLETQEKHNESAHGHTDIKIGFPVVSRHSLIDELFRQIRGIKSILRSYQLFRKFN